MADDVLPFANVTATAALVSLVDAKQQLRITGTIDDAEIARLSWAATDEILSYLKRGADPAWTPDTVPRPVQQAILILLTHRYEHRGDDMSPTATGLTPDEKVWDAIGRMLARFRDPACV